MALQYNQIMREGLANVLLTSGAYFSSGNLRIYTTAVSYPNAPSASNALIPSGHVLNYTATWQRTGSTLTLTAGTNTSATALLSGPISWWAVNTSANGYVCSDSIGLSGSGSIVTISTMNASSGSTITVSFNLSVV